MAVIMMLRKDEGTCYKGPNMFIRTRTTTQVERLSLPAVNLLPSDFGGSDLRGK